MISGRLGRFLKVLPVLVSAGLGSACRDRQEEAREMVLGSGYRTTIEDFLKAAREGRGAVVAQFLVTGMRVDATDRTGRTALLEAAQAGQTHLVQQLLEAGASVDRADAEGVTPLMAAASVGDGISVQALRTAGALISRVDITGQNALQAAAAAGHVGVVELLVPESGGGLEEVLWLAATGGHTGVIDGVLKAELAGSRSQLDWAGLLQAAASGDHLPAVRLLSSRMPSNAESDQARITTAQAARAEGRIYIADFLEEEQRRTTVQAPPLAAVPLTESTLVVNAEHSVALEPLPEAIALPVSLVLSTARTPLAGARFIKVPCEAMAQVPELIQMTAWEPRAWPVVLQDVAAEHGTADLLLTEEPTRTVTLKVGDEIPGTGCVVEKLRRRRVYTDAAETDLKNVSELHFRRISTGEVFKALAGESVLSNDSSANLRLSGVDHSQTTVPGDEFRLGSLLLRVATISAGAVTLENRLTRETVKILLTANPLANP